MRLQTIKDTVHDKLWHVPENKGIPNLHDRNHFYYIMEFFEAQFMHHFTAQILKQILPHSLILRHDGIYIAPMPDINLINQAANEANSNAGLQGVRVKITNLEEARSNALRELYKPNEQQQHRDVTNGPFEHGKAFFSKLTHEEWWANVHVEKPIEEDRRTRQVIANKRPYLHEEDDRNTLLRFFIRRKVLP